MYKSLLVLNFKSVFLAQFVYSTPSCV